jgi:hypothetical protein
MPKAAVLVYAAWRASPLSGQALFGRIKRRAWQPAFGVGLMVTFLAVEAESVCSNTVWAALTESLRHSRKNCLLGSPSPLSLLDAWLSARKTLFLRQGVRAVNTTSLPMNW